MPEPVRPKMWQPVVALVVTSFLTGSFIGSGWYPLGFIGLVAGISTIVWVMRRAVLRSERSAGAKVVTGIAAAAGAVVVALVLLGIGTGLGVAVTGGSSATSSGAGGNGSGAGVQKPTDFAVVSERDFSDIVANPGEHRGRALVIFGKVTQFDSRTGASTFRADTGGERVQAASASGYVSYAHNSMLSGPESVLGGLVQDDVFEAQVTVTGGSSYKSQANFNLTVPNFEVHSIKIIGGDNAEPIRGKRGSATTIGNLSFTVSDVTATKSLKSRYDARSGDFILITISFENQGKEAFTLDDGDFNLVEDDGTTYRPLDTAYRWIDDDISYESVNPKSTLKGRLIFENPPNVALDQLFLQVTDGSQRGLISLNA